MKLVNAFTEIDANGIAFVTVDGKRFDRDALKNLKAQLGDSRTVGELAVWLATDCPDPTLADVCEYVA